MDHQQQQFYQQDEKQDMHNQYQQQPYPYQQLHQQPVQKQPPYPEQPYPQEAYPQQQQLLQPLNQPSVVVAPQPAMNWVYTDLPEQRLKTLGIIQVVIGSIFFVLNIFSSDSNFLGYCWSILILGSGVATLVALRRKDKLMVIVSGVLALCAAILTALFIIFTIIVMIIAFIAYFYVSSSTSGSSYGYGSSYGSGSNYGSNSGYDSNDRSSQTAVNMVYILALIIFLASIALQGCVLTISIMLAVVSRRIVQTKRPVPPNSGAPVGLVTSVQA